MEAVETIEAEAMGRDEVEPANVPSRLTLVLWAFGLFALSFALFMIGIAQPPDIYFDETWYVPTARTLLKTGEMLHQEHPPLGKLMIAAGMSIFGDNPLGWRFFSVVFGAATISGVFVWSAALLESAPAAVWVAVVTFLDAVVYVQARIAMLDIFLIAFAVFALAFFTYSFTARSAGAARACILVTGLCLGLAAACKWSGWFLEFGLVALVLTIGLLRLWRARFEDPRPTDFHRPDAPFAWSPLNSLFGFVLAPFFTYFLTYLPQMLHTGTIAEFWQSHVRMIDIMSGHSPDHPYMSLWYTWPILKRPIWYEFQVPGAETSDWSAAKPAMAVVGMPNPAVLALGELALLYLLWRFFARRELKPAIVAIAYVSEFLPWAINPKGLEFAYYFFPSVVALGPAMGLAIFSPGWGRWTRPLAGIAAAICLGFFLFFLPVWAAGIGVTPAAFDMRMWLTSWR